MAAGQKQLTEYVVPSLHDSLGPTLHEPPPPLRAHWTPGPEVHEAGSFTRGTQCPLSHWSVCVQ